MVFFRNYLDTFTLFPKRSNERTRGEDAPEDVETRPTVGDCSVRLEDTLADGAESPRQPPGELGAPAESSSPLRSSPEPPPLSPEPPPDAAGSEEEQEPCACRLASRPEAGTGAQDSAPLDQELYNSFHFWRTPLPEIDLDVELEQGSASEPGPQRLDVEPEVPASSSTSITMATRKELEEMIENLEPHIDDPDVKGMGGSWFFVLMKCCFLIFFLPERLPFKNRYQPLSSCILILSMIGLHFRE